MRCAPPIWLWLLPWALACTAACGRVDSRAGPAATHARYTERISTFGIDETLMGRRWREAASRALREPMPVSLPHAEQGALLAYKADALGLTFEASAGQVLQIEFARQAAAESWTDEGRIYIDVFRTEPSDTGTVYRRVENVTVEGTSLHVPMRDTAHYVVRIQPELLVNVVYGLTLELAAALPFPVDGRSISAVHSYFGDERDAGARAHEGIDIFADRHTPVVAVSDGRAMPRQNNLGGNVVWLNTPGVSYYYAHLERQAVDRPQRVKAGDVLGYVGNSGNAATTRPHLHFGIYRWGRGAVDPLPQLLDRRLPEETAPEPQFEPHLVDTSAPTLNMRAGPSTEAPVLAQLSTGTVVSVLGQSGEWLRVDEPRRGWIHSLYQRPLDAGESLSAQIASPFALIMDSPGRHAQPLGILARGDRYRTLAARDGPPIVQASDAQLTGWLVVP